MNREKSARQSLSVPSLSLQPETFSRSWKLRFITPVFGGGVDMDANELKRHQKARDEITPVRGASIRGQLRWWWRLVCGRGLPPETLRAREGVLWGLSEQKGWVGLSIKSADLRPRDLRVYDGYDEQGRFNLNSRYRGLAYGAFPLQPSRDAQRAQEDQGVLREYSGEFTLSLRGRGELQGELRDKAAKAWSTDPHGIEDILWAEAERSVLAFVTLGGFGGRTRRGFGAVERVDAFEEPAIVLKKLGFKAGSWAIGRGSSRDGISALNDVLLRLRNFRQGEDEGRNPPKDRRPGRSRWPEPDEIRRLEKTWFSNHVPKLTVHAFPRAVFGLPIIFQFKDERQGDPQKQTLLPSGSQRFASPLLLRPIQIARGMYAPLALILPGQHLKKVLGDLSLNTRTGLRGTIDASEYQQIRPLQGHAIVPDADDPSGVLHAFLDSFSNSKP